VSWFDRFCWPRAALSDLQRDVAAGYVLLEEIRNSNVDIKRELQAMAAREDAAYEKLNATILTVKDGWASLVAERDALKAALEASDANAAAQVQAALDADSEVDAGKVEAADAALAEIAPVTPPVEG